MIYPQKYRLEFSNTAAYDVLTEAHICRVLHENFGKPYIRSSSLFKTDKDGEYRILTCVERDFRSFLTNIHNALEIGTGLGVSALLLAHYAYHLTTIDSIPFTEPLPLWARFGVHRKITYVATDPTKGIPEQLKEKADFINELDFDFAFIDSDKSYRGVKFDFDLVKRCGRVLFACYGYEQYGELKKFVDELPRDEITIKSVFAYWEKR